MTAPYNEKTKQYLLKFALNAYFGEEDFLVTSCNKLAYQTIKSWPYWPHFALNIFGPQSSGKSHLAHIWINEVEKFIPRPVDIPIIRAENINMKNIHKLAENNNYLVIEDVTSEINEEAFFHLYNMYNIPEHFILFTSTLPFAKMKLKLPDLRSRLNTIPSAEISMPDDEMLIALIAKLFNDRQIIISQEVLNYILNNSERSFEYISRLVDEIDNLSWTYSRQVTIPLVKDAINNLSKNQQLDLFV